MTDWAVFGIGAAFLVKTLVNALKTLGLPGKYALYAALAIGLVLAVGNRLAEMSPAFATWFRVVFQGIIAALVAAELYDTGRVLSELMQQSAIER